MEKIILTPSPISLLESMRDVGYSLESAIADIIDNSLTAKSTQVDVKFSWNNNDPWLAIIDNGHGMSKENLVNAMRLGSQNPLELRDHSDLGRFGLGLKTASFSQCRCLTVLSKKDKLTTCVRWDLDYLTQSKDDNWTLQVLSPEEILQQSTLSNLSNDYLNYVNSGTIILWEKNDRLNDSIKNKETVFDQLLAETRQHIELIFHNFLIPHLKFKKTVINFNNSELIGFDPFNIKKSTELREEVFKFEGEEIKVQPYILPHHNKVSTEEWKRFSGKQGYLHEQGFYIYRNRRLIIHSNWFRLIKKEELTKLLRVRIDIPNTLDHLWKIDIKKSNAFPPPGIREELKRIIGKIGFSGKKVFKQRGQVIPEKEKYPTWNRVAKNNQIFYKINRNHPIIASFLDSSTINDKDKFSDILSIIESSFPRASFYNDVATVPESVNVEKINKEGLRRLIDCFTHGLSKVDISIKMKEIINIEPFSSNIETTMEIIKEITND